MLSGLSTTCVRKVSQLDPYRRKVTGFADKQMALWKYVGHMINETVGGITFVNVSDGCNETLLHANKSPEATLS